MQAELAAPQLGSFEHCWFDLRRKFDLGWSRLALLSERLPSSEVQRGISRGSGGLRAGSVHGTALFLDLWLMGLRSEGCSSCCCHYGLTFRCPREFEIFYQEKMHCGPLLEGLWALNLV